MIATTNIMKCATIIVPEEQRVVLPGEAQFSVGGREYPDRPSCKLNICFSRHDRRISSTFIADFCRKQAVGGSGRWAGGTIIKQCDITSRSENALGGITPAYCYGHQ